MPRVKDVYHTPKVVVSYETCKQDGAQVRCLACGYVGAADVIRMRSRRNGKRAMERCPECKSLNIVCEDHPIKPERLFVQLEMFDHAETDL